VGTARGTIQVRRGSHRVTVPVPLSAGELAQIASAGRGRAFTAGDAGGLSTVYARLAAKLGHTHVKREMTASVAGLGLALLLVGSTLSLRWFGRLV
jgi:Ca-activated chloride channel homolog